MNINLINEVMEIVKISPLLLLDKIENPEILEIANNILPYSTGIEIEAPYIRQETPVIEGLYLLNKRIYYGNEEVTFRIPNGYKGLLALELFSNEIKSYLTESDSGNHYHIDLSQDYYNTSKAIEKESEYILLELDKWDYKGTYNKRKVVENIKGNWVNLRSGFQTAEIRIGELAIDYSTLFQRITHCNNIITEIRRRHNILNPLVFDNNIKKEEIIDSINKVEKNYKEYNEKIINELKLKQLPKEKIINQNSKQAIDFVKNKKIICY